MNVKKFKDSVTFPLSLMQSPIWLFDVDELTVVWANTSALLLCEVSDLATLQRLNIAFDLSCKAAERPKHCQVDVNSVDDTMTEFLTLYLDDKPVTYECTIGAMSTPVGGRWLMVTGIRLVKQSEAEALYQNHALTHTSVSVSMYSLDGRLKYANPAACSMLGENTLSLADRFDDFAEWQSINTGLRLGNEVQTEARVATAAGYAWHSVTLRICSDPVFSDSSILVTEQDISARRQAQAQVQQLAYFDELTGLPNRTAWNQTMEAMLEVKQQPLAVLFMDIDGFKAINDTYGHEIGDKLLIAFGMRISDCLNKGEYLARLGGDEFTLLMPDDEGGVLSARKSQLILDSLANPIIIDGHEVSIAPSIGISRLAADTAKEAGQLMREADVAMYAAKKAGGGFKQFDAQMLEPVQSHLFFELDSGKAQGRSDRRRGRLQQSTLSITAS